MRVTDWSLSLVCVLQTSVEYQINRSRRNRRLHGGKVVSPYSAGSVHANWELVFGPCQFKLLSLLPSTARAPQGTSASLSTSSAMGKPERVSDASTAHAPDVMV